MNWPTEVLHKQLEDHKHVFYEVAPDPSCRIDPQGQQEFEQRAIPVQCSVCKATEFLPEASLREKGWSLTWKRGERCPEHAN